MGAIVGLIVGQGQPVTPPEPPRTPDTSMGWIWLAVVALALLIGAVVLYTRRGHRRRLGQQRSEFLDPGERSDVLDAGRRPPTATPPSPTEVRDEERRGRASSF